MHAYIIVSETQDSRLKWLHDFLLSHNIAPVDTVHMPKGEKGYGIQAVRDFTRALYRAPTRSQYTVGIIEGAEGLSIQAQHALLKTVEEPPPHVIVVLTTPNQNSLLPTLTSRCTIISVPEEHRDLATSNGSTSQFLEISRSTIGEKLLFVDSVTTNEGFDSWIDETIGSLHQIMTETNSAHLTIISYSKWLRSLLALRVKRANNISAKLLLDDAILHQ